MTEAGIILAVVGIILSGLQLALYLKDKRRHSPFFGDGLESGMKFGVLIYSGVLPRSSLRDSGNDIPVDGHPANFRFQIGYCRIAAPRHRERSQPPSQTSDRKSVV